VQIDLVWDGPYSWFGETEPMLFGSPAAERAGLYVWTAAMPEGEWVHYVGQTTKGYGDRHWAHWREYASGAYGIDDPAEFSAGRRRLLYHGFTFRKPAHRHAGPFFAAVQEHVTAAVAFLQRMRIWVADLPPERRLQRRVESAVIKALYRQEGPAATFQDPNMRTEPRRFDEPPYALRIHRPPIMVGLPDELEA